MHETKLAKVESVYLGVEDHGILTLDIRLAYGGSGQVFGGYSLDTYDKVKKRRVGHAAGTDYLLRVLSLFGVSTLDKIVGRTVFAVLDGVGFNARIIGLKMPDFDGGKSFMAEDWRKEWFGVDHG